MVYKFHFYIRSCQGNTMRHLNFVLKGFVKDQLDVVVK